MNVTIENPVDNTAVNMRFVIVGELSLNEMMSAHPV